MSSSGDVGFTGGLFASIGVADHLELFAEAGYRRAGGHTVVVPALVRVRRDSLRIGAGPAAVVALDPDADDDRFGVAAVLSAGWSIPPYPYHGLVLDFRYQHGLTSSSRVGLVMAGLSF